MYDWSVFLKKAMPIKNMRVKGPYQFKECAFLIVNSEDSTEPH